MAERNWTSRALREVPYSNWNWEHIATVLRDLVPCANVQAHDLTRYLPGVKVGDEWVLRLKKEEGADYVLGVVLRDYDFRPAGTDFHGEWGILIGGPIVWDGKGYHQPKNILDPQPVKVEQVADVLVSMSRLLSIHIMSILQGGRVVIETPADDVTH